MLDNFETLNLSLSKLIRTFLRQLGGLMFLAALLVLARPAQLSGQELLRVDSFPTGVRPLGVDLLAAGNLESLMVVVANSGDDSVSIFRVKISSPDNLAGTQYALELLTTVRAIPAPYAVVSCSSDFLGERVLVTSPTDNSVTVVRVPDGGVLGRIPVGPQPHAVACFRDSSGAYKGLVSNAGDDTLIVLDVASLTVETRIPEVPASRGLHGIRTGGINLEDPAWVSSQAWVGGTNADAVTLLDLRTLRVLTRIPVRGPTGVRPPCAASALDNTVSCYSEALRPTTLFFPPSPQDFVMLNTNTGLLPRPWDKLWLASTGAASSVAYFGTSTQGRDQGIIPGVPDAAGMASFNFLAGRSSVTRGGWTFFVVVTSPISNRLFLIQWNWVAPAPREFGIANGASFEPTVAVNSVASLFGNTGASGSFVANSLPLPKALGRVSVLVGGSLVYDSASSRWNYSPTGSIEAPLWFVGPNQVNFQMPPEIIPNQTVPLQLRRPDGSTLLSTQRIGAAVPGIFSLLMNGRGQGAVLNEDNSLNGDPLTILGTRPSGRGSVIQIFATGAGATTPPLLAGEPAPASGNPLVFTQVQPTVTIGGRPARVLFSGMAPGYVGVWQINAEVPMDVAPGPAVALQVIAGGVQSNTVTIAVQ